MEGTWKWIAEWKLSEFWHKNPVNVPENYIHIVIVLQLIFSGPWHTPMLTKKSSSFFKEKALQKKSTACETTICERKLIKWKAGFHIPNTILYNTFESISWLIPRKSIAKWINTNILWPKCQEGQLDSGKANTLSFFYERTALELYYSLLI